MMKLFGIIAVLMILTQQLVLGQITFSKDWRAGGKRSTTLSSNGVSVVDVPCDQLAEYQTTKIKNLVRVSSHSEKLNYLCFYLFLILFILQQKEAIALLQCEYNIDKNEEPKKR